MLEPAAAFLKDVATSTERRVGLPVVSQSEIYSMRPTAMPWRPEGRFSKDLEVGKTVDRVPRVVRCRMRRAITADSYVEGRRSVSSSEGLLKTFCGDVGRKDDATKGI